MKILKRLAILFALGMLAGAAFGQISQSSYEVNLTWTAPSVCTTAAPCTFPISRTTITAGATCPTTGSSYALVGTSASQATTFSDTTVAAGTSYCYVAQTTQAGATSAPSAPFSIAVPTLPVAPSSPGAVTTITTVTVTTIP